MSNPYATTQRPPWIERPSSGQDFIANGSVALPATGTGAVICAYYLKINRSGVILTFSNEFVGGNWTPGDGTLYWQLYRNGACLPGFNSITFSYGGTANPRYLSGTRVRGGDLIQLYAFNVAVPTSGQLLNGVFSGYEYPRDLDPRAIW
jgi:hypothetical protein